MNKTYLQDAQRAEDAYRKAMIGVEQRYLHQLQSLPPSLFESHPGDAKWRDEEFQRISDMMAMLNNVNAHVDPMPSGTPASARVDQAVRLAMEWSNPDFSDAVKAGMSKDEALKLMVRPPDSDNTREDGAETMVWRYKRAGGASGGQYGMSGEDADKYFQNAIDSRVPAGDSRISIANGVVIGVSKSKE